MTKKSSPATKERRLEIKAELGDDLGLFLIIDIGEIKLKKEF